MKKILIVLLSTLCISAFGQNVKLNEKGEIVKVETITTESPISSVSIDRQIEFYKTTIELLTKKIKELEAVKTEVLILRGRIKTNGKPCIAIAGNSNSTVTLDNLTMINIGGTYSVESNQNNSIIVKPGCASNVTTSANITQLGTGIYVDPNFNN